MPRRLRTLVGTIAILVFVCVYALFAIAVADSRIVDAPKLVQTLVYFLLGTIWVLPIMPLIKWMEGGRR
jgi:predicted membrane channel-forming protein YqfA (hemolysin III family)